MRHIPIYACLCLFAVTSHASAQSWEAKCLATMTSGDAIITCLKASMLIQREQIRLQRSLLHIIAEQINPTLRETSRNTRAASNHLEKLSSLLDTAIESLTPHLLISDLRNFDDAGFACDETELCESGAQSTADTLCKRLGYGAQHAYEFENQDGAARLKWLVCRP